MREDMDMYREVLRMSVPCFALVFGFAFILGTGVQAWSKEGHVMTCLIAQDLLSPEAERVMKMLLPDYAKGNLSSLCVWPDEIRMKPRYRWASPLHYINTPDNACTFNYKRDCHNPKGVQDMCVAGAIQNFTAQLSYYEEGASDQRYNMTEALLFLSHFVGDIHQPLHVGFTSDEGGNTIELRWYGHKSNLHHVWDREIILTAAKDYYGRKMNLLEEDIAMNVTDGIWHDEVATWKTCNGIHTCVTKWASESITAACKWAYADVEPGITLKDEYFDTRMPIVMKRIAQGGVRLAMILNDLFGETEKAEIPSIDQRNGYLLSQLPVVEKILAQGRIYLAGILNRIFSSPI